MLPQPAGGQPPDPGLLRRPDGLRGCTESGPRAGLHLAEDDRPAETNDEIQLALPAAPVAVQDLVPVLQVPGRSLVLAGGAEGAALLRPRRAGNDYSSFSGSSSTLTSLNVTTRTDETNRAGRYMSQTQASRREISK